MLDSIEMTDDVKSVKTELKWYKNRYKVSQFIFSSIVLVIILFIVTMFDIIAIAGANAIDKEVHLSQFTMNMAQIFFSVGPIVLYLYIALNYIRSLCDIFHEEFTEFFRIVSVVWKGLCREILKEDK